MKLLKHQFKNTSILTSKKEEGKMKDKKNKDKIVFGKVFEMVLPEKYEIPIEEIRNVNGEKTKTTHCLDCLGICENH